MNELTARVQALEALFRHVQATRMAGVPVLNAALAVEAVGFQPVPVEAGEPPAAVGVLVTPWFMNLVWLPLQPEAGADRVGQARARDVGGTSFEFIGAHEPGLGAYEACSLASPMFEFPDQAQARATAWAVLAELRPAAPQASSARRGFLFGRSAVKASA
ncbi:[NiFe]-hydrogenase assembly chaperone HybE [Roseateles puraquae]|uniref:Protein hoxT n=1 Tax=Roseateles puraquae TaxID=431059 RepID=A0A254N0P0_9BURK|nr:[NiFe]-hydrogenase assembly chaperone HybE [Roseateles puraquae]MDG0854343.1 [NiFe]-hydrogenase assembly, chaperone, HybE [Roseateles puraquae]OWR00748.1 protein hoxT [Roseateles puraquae]RTL46785.1 MAG: [NiFe]-hydrogenase assembly, chaperone, HybE [Burkholderiales bacterium]